jgi:hypothetical protein
MDFNSTSMTNASSRVNFLEEAISGFIDNKV